MFKRLLPSVNPYGWKVPGRGRTKRDRTREREKEGKREREGEGKREREKELPRRFGLPAGRLRLRIKTRKSLMTQGLRSWKLRFKYC